MNGGLFKNNRARSACPSANTSRQSVDVNNNSQTSGSGSGSNLANLQRLLKAPFNLLAELCTKLDIEVKCDEKFIDKLSIFECYITLRSQNNNGNTEVKKYSYVKKDAKHVAAYDLLLQLQNGLNKDEKAFDVVKVEIERTKEYMKQYDIQDVPAEKVHHMLSEFNPTELVNNHSEATFNAFGELIAISKMHGKIEPKYVWDDSWVGPSHKPIFTCHMSYDGIIETANGYSKQSSKTAAAQKILTRLKSISPQSSYEKFLLSNGELIKLLLNDFDSYRKKFKLYVDALNALCLEQNFFYVFSNITKKKVIIDVNTVPEFFTTGYGDTEETAREDAAAIVLDSIRWKCAQIKKEKNSKK